MATPLAAVASGSSDGNDKAPVLRASRGLRPQRLRTAAGKGKGKGTDTSSNSEGDDDTSSSEGTSSSDSSSCFGDHPNTWTRRIRQADSDWSAFNDTGSSSSGFSEEGDYGLSSD